MTEWLGLQISAAYFPVMSIDPERTVHANPLSSPEIRTPYLFDSKSQPRQGRVQHGSAPRNCAKFLERSFVGHYPG